jgi:hypothetical protein
MIGQAVIRTSIPHYNRKRLLMQLAIYKLVFFHVQKGDVRVVGVNHGLINYIDTKAKCRHVKKIDL